ncbi:lytic transglycosylase domain-containing protein [bacterium]|nr:lytic transglycosylase domain-containing protein [bacterium]
MFSAKIQSLINEGGKDAAMTRAAQLVHYVNNFNKNINNITSNEVKSPKFADVLQESIDDTYRFRDINANKRVFGTLVKPTNTKSEDKIYSRQEISNIISEISSKHGVSDKLVSALIKQESGFNPTAVSKAGATGLMQLMPATAKTLGVQDAKNPVQNVDGGVRYLKSMIERYNGNLILALAAYNAGPGAVDKYGGVPPYKETQNYVKNILANYLKK